MLPSYLEPLEIFLITQNILQLFATKFFLFPYTSN